MWSVAFALIPKRYLIAAAALVAVLVSGIVWYHVHMSHVYDSGYNAGYNHAVVIETRKQTVIVDSLERRADSIAAIANAGDRLSVVRDSTDAQLRAHPRIARIVPLATDSLIPTVALSNLVAVYFASDSIPTPHYADVAVAHLVAWQDTAIYVTLLPQRDSAIAFAFRWKAAYVAEHEARESADSLSALYAERLRSQTVLPGSPSRLRRTVEALALLGGGYFIAKHIR